MTEPLAILRQERDRLAREIEGLQAKVNAIDGVIVAYAQETGQAPAARPTPSVTSSDSKRYVSTKPCRNGHIGERYIKGDVCCQCAYERTRRRRETPAQPAATVPVAKPAPSDDPAVTAWLANHKVTRPDNEPDVDQVMNEVRRTGDVVVPLDEKFERFAINMGTTVDRLQLLLRANRSRTKRGMPIWDEGAIKWERPPEPENPLAAHQKNGAASAKRARGLAP